MLLITFQLTAPITQTLSLFYCYFQGKSDQLHKLVPPVQTFIVKTQHSLYTEANYHYSLHNPLHKRISRQLLPNSHYFMKKKKKIKHPIVCFPDR